MNKDLSLDSLADAGSTLASPLAEVAAQPAPVPQPESFIETPVAAIASGPAIAPVVAAVTVATPAAPLGTLPSAAHSTLPMLGALLLVVGLILGLGKLVKRVQNARAGAGGPQLSIKGGLQIGAKERVVWMQAGDTHLLLGVSPGSVQTLHVFDVAPDFAAASAAEPLAKPAAETPATKDFSERLKTLLEHARAKGMAIETVATPAPATAGRAAAPPATFSFRA